MHLTRPALVRFRPPATVVLCLDRRPATLVAARNQFASPLTMVRHSTATICRVPNVSNFVWRPDQMTAGSLRGALHHCARSLDL